MMLLYDLSFLGSRADTVHYILHDWGIYEPGGDGGFRFLMDGDAGDTRAQDID